MKRLVKGLLTLALVVSTAACQSTTTSDSSTTVSGSAKGFGGDVTVTLTLYGETISAVEIDASSETETIGQAATETLSEQVLEAQSASIDGVSGATVTSDAVKAAVTAALNQVNGSTGEKTAVSDGTYNVKVASFGWKGMMELAVTFVDNAISSIEVVSETDSLTGEIAQTAFDNFIPRVIENQSLATDTISGATVTSNAIKSGVSLAIEQAGGNPSEWYEEVEKSNETVTLDGYDVLVVGLGGSGVMSYCAAADQGAKVIGLETTAKLGGNSATTTGPMALNSENLKQSENNGEDYIDADAVYQTWIDYVGTDEKADVIYKAVYESGSALDYYMDNFDFEFAGMIGSFANPEWTKMWTRYVGEDGTSNALGPNKTYQFDRAMEKAKAMNEDNDYLLEVTVDSLIFDENGAITGVNAYGYDGTTYQVFAKTVILATGGYIGNADMMSEYLDGPTNTVAVTTENGTGIQLGLSAGASLYNPSVPPMIHITQIPNMIKDDSLNATQKTILSAFALNNAQLAVTANGEVWDHSKEISLAPNYRYYVIYSQSQMDDYKTNGLSEDFASCTSMFLNQSDLTAVPTLQPVEDLDTILQVGMDTNNVLYGESIDALAKAIGCDAQTLRASINNEEGAYYAVIASGYAYATVGGLNVDNNFNVLDTNNRPIANLYAVGQDCMGVTNTESNVYTPWGGQAQSWTFVSGKNAGENAAKSALAQ